MARLYELRRQHRSLRKSTNTRLPERTEALRNVFPSVRITRVKDEDPPPRGRSLRLMTRSASSIRSQAAGLPIIQTRNASKRTTSIRTKCSQNGKSCQKMIYSHSLQSMKERPTDRKQEAQSANNRQHHWTSQNPRTKT